MIQAEADKHLTNYGRARMRLLLDCVVRVFVVLLALQISGFGHVLADSRMFGDNAGVEHGDCSSDVPGRDCPPGCPTCHHANGGVGSPPRQVTFALLPSAPQATRFIPNEPETPSNAELPSVFRPPKPV